LKDGSRCEVAVEITCVEILLLAGSGHSNPLASTSAMADNQPQAGLARLLILSLRQTHLDREPQGVTASARFHRCGNSSPIRLCCWVGRRVGESDADRSEFFYDRLLTKRRVAAVFTKRFVTQSVAPQNIVWL